MPNKGWDHLINPLLEACAANNIKVTQVKEKFGGLRFYTETAPPFWLQAKIEHAEEASYHTCEMCGKEGHLRKNRPWLKTLCEECNA